MEEMNFGGLSLEEDVDEYDDFDPSEEKEQQLFDTMCAICDDGGDVLPCEGPCKRSFHAVKGDADEESKCRTLGYMDHAEIKAMPVFLCPNCKYEQHQCFACGKLGSSSRSLGTEVFPCVSGTCGYFYHPNCVARLLHPDDEARKINLQTSISMGESFICPVHKCLVCQQVEDKDIYELQFAVCRRCPKAYHRKCLPRSISFTKDESKNILQRAWENLLPNRILIYCRDHPMMRGLNTPSRNHLKFPEVEDKGRSAALSGGILPGDKVKEKYAIRIPDTVEQSRGVAKVAKPLNRLVKLADAEAHRRKSTSAAEVKSMEVNKSIHERIEKIMKENTRSSSFPRSKTSSLNVGQISHSKQKELSTSICNNNRIRLQDSLHPSEYAEIRERMSALFEESASSVDIEDLRRKQYGTSGSQFMSDKNITLGKVEGFVKAIKTAVQKIEDGGTIEEAKEICEPGILDQMYIWKRKLKVYLAPFLYGPRYTSFGRHFTKDDKLQEIVERLHHYVLNGDTIVDFCCGSNQFSLLMKEKLEITGKCSFFKNYDLFPPQDWFNFEQRDWMEVGTEELPNGSQLIMGLNPPFGAKASRANQFIEKALTFKPKLLILIVPEETKSVDAEDTSYDLVWKDTVLLSGKAFYLPGSVDVRNEQLEDWNNNPPPLYLWSRSDWTSRHKEVAESHGHLYL